VRTGGTFSSRRRLFASSSSGSTQPGNAPSKTHNHRGAQKSRTFHEKRTALGYLSIQKPLHFPAEGFAFLLGALHAHPKGAGDDQAEQLHKALSVGPAHAVIQVYREILPCGHGHKILNVPDTAQTDHKFIGILHLELYKPFFFMYNGENCETTHTIYYKGFLPENN
jgi:hypothetical protein